MRPSACCVLRVCVCACVRACVCVCACACVRVCVRACRVVSAASLRLACWHMQRRVACSTGAPGPYRGRNSCRAASVCVDFKSRARARARVSVCLSLRVSLLLARRASCASCRVSSDEVLLICLRARAPTRWPAGAVHTLPATQLQAACTYRGDWVKALPVGWITSWRSASFSVTDGFLSCKARVGVPPSLPGRGVRALVQ